MNTILRTSIALILLVISVSIVGLLYPEIYRAAPPTWLTQSVGQDAIDLFLVVPVLIIGTLYSFTSHRVAVYLWLGTLLYLVYTFMIYCFAVRFNPLFIPYCFILGISLFSFLWFFAKDQKKFTGDTENKFLRIIGIYFIVVSVAFYSLWLSEVIPATINNEIPEGTREAGLFTNPVHVLDLSIFLPGTFMIGILALRRTLFSTVMAPALLTFFILMHLTIAVLSVIMAIRGVGGSYIVAIFMTCAAVFTILLLIGYVHAGRSYETNEVALQR